LSRANEVSRGTAISELPLGWSCYLLLCVDGRYYCGITSNLPQRLRDHRSGRGGSFTSDAKPLALVWYERHNDRSSAARREHQLKSWNHTKKATLAEGRWRLSPSAVAVRVSLD